jgi:hypothetical protein
MLKAAGRFFNSDTSMWILVAIVVVVLVWALMSYSGNKSNRVRDAFGNGAGAQPNQPASSLAAASQPLASMSSPPPSKPTPPPPSSLQARPTLKPSDIVLNPVNVPDLIMSPQAFIGVDTISNWLKNPSYDLRSDPIIPKVDVGPWNNSTYEADLMRVPFEIGACGR